jgi:beta-glucanase (GH16 family)
MEGPVSGRLMAQALCLVVVMVQVMACGGDKATSSTPTGPSPTPVPGGGSWQLVFSDEFDTPGTPDPSKWGYELGYIRNNELQFYTSRPANVRAEGGTLVIEGRKEPFQGYGYTSASINTLGRFEFLYGRVEVRAQLPTGNGAWPAIWMLGVNRLQVGWPTCGEIDIMEYVGFDPNRVHGTVHTALYSRGAHKTSSISVANPWEGFHVYAMEWYPDRIEIFLDGQRYFTFRNEGTGNATWPFDKPQYLLLNLAIGGSWGGQRGIDDSRFPHRYLIDYVRIYQQR